MLVMAKCKDTQGQKRDANEEQAPVERDHDGDAAGKEQNVGEKREQGVGTDTLDFTNVVVNARDEVAELALGEKTRRKFLQVTVHRETHVKEALRGEADVEIAGANIQRKTGDGDHDHQNGDGPEGVKIVANESVVNQETGDVRLRETYGGGKQTEGGDQRQSSRIRRNEHQGSAIWSDRDVARARGH